MRRDLEFIPIQHGEQRFVLIQDRLGLVQEGLGIALYLYQFITLLDGTRTVRDLQAELTRHRGGVLISGQEVEDMLTKLDDSFLLDSDKFIKAKKKTNIQLMGKDFTAKIEEYRNIFPAGKLPSGKPGRQNVKALAENFRWFFETYDHSWEAIIKATKMYVNEYRATDYKYMMTSQYFISKQDKHKVKHSELADYCDMINDGVQTQVHHFKEKVV